MSLWILKNVRQFSVREDRSTFRHPDPSDRTPVPRPPHISPGVPGEITAGGSQLGEGGALKGSPGTARPLPRSGHPHPAPRVPSPTGVLLWCVLLRCCVLPLWISLYVLLQCCTAVVGRSVGVWWVVGARWVAARSLPKMPGGREKTNHPATTCS